MTYRIRTVSEITGIPRNTLIAWERRYGFIRPERHENGYRSYSEEDLSALLKIRNALSAGLKISEAIELVERKLSPPELKEAQLHLPGDTVGVSYPEIISGLIEALIHYRGREAEQILSNLVTLPFETRIHKIFFPVLTEIGTRWERGAINVAQEHYASAIIRDQLVGMLVGVGTRSASAPHAVCATFPEEHHEIPALALAVHLGLHGYRVSYLGANLPAADLIDFCQKQDPSLVCISLIRGVSNEVLTHYAAELRARVPGTCRLVLGGSGLKSAVGMQLTGVEIIPNWHEFRL